MYIPKILALFLSAVAGAASSDIHSPTLNTEEDVVVSSPNLRSLATTKQRDLARTKKAKPFDDDGFDLTLSLEVELPKKAGLDLFKKSLTSILRKVVANYDKDGTTVLGFVLLEAKPRRELAPTQTVTIIKFVLTLNSICTRPALNEIQQNNCFCAAGEDILALLNLAVDDVTTFIGSLGLDLKSFLAINRAIQLTGIDCVRG